MKRKFLFSLVAILMLAATANAQTDTTKVEKKWQRSGKASLTLSQSSFNNWAAGGDNAVAGTAAASYKILYKSKRVVWENNFDAAYGLTFQDSEKRKNEDRLEVNSQLSYELKKPWYLTSLLQFKTQFDKGYDSYPKGTQQYNSKFMAPAYLTFMPIGFEYRPNDHFSLAVSPLTTKFTFVFDDMLSDKGAFGVDKGKKVKSELGAFLKATYQQKFFEKVALKTKLELFSSYTNQPKNIDVNWEVDLQYQVTKWLSTSFYSQLLYDNDTKYFDTAGVRTNGPRVQFKQVLGMGVSFLF